MKSMTGYGHSIYRNENYTIELEIKSYNNRYLDISHSINPFLSSFENYIDEKIKLIAKRGHLDVSLRLKVLRSDSNLTLDEELFKKYLSIYEKIAKEANLPGPSLSDFASIDGLISSEKNTDQSIYKEGVDAVLDEALAMLASSKERDGKGTHADLLKLGESFKEALSGVEAREKELEDHFKSILSQKYEELLGVSGKDDPRFLSEVAALLVKYSINEEVSRLSVHMKEYFRLLSLEEPVGKQLDFLCQEMNRECNTIASKSQLVDINLLVVRMKDNLENIREQIRNIE